jgi:hypothetical protein
LEFAWINEVFGTAPLLFFQLGVAKHPRLQELRSTKKKVELEANSTFFLEHLKGYSSFWSFVLPHGVVG